MTQQLNDLTVESWVSGVPTVHRMQQDLLSLRAAVRRVLEADIDEGALRNGLGRQFEKALDALSAEMATIDNDNSKEQKPC